MSRGRKSKSRLQITERALRDIVDIEQYSIREFGRRVTNPYLTKLESTLTRIAEQPDLLTADPEFHSWLRFDRVEKHVLVCDVASNRMTVLTLIHTSMETPRSLVELEPVLTAELDQLHRRLAGGGR